MRKLLSLARHRFVAISLVLLLSFLVLHNLYLAADSSKNYFVEIIAAIMGAILTVVITGMLLGEQTQGEELKERQVEVFKRKLALYDEFIDEAMKALADDSLDESEVTALSRSVYKIALIGSGEAVETASAFLRSYAADGDETDRDIGLLINAFRADLKLHREGDDVGLTTDDLGSLRTIITRDAGELRKRLDAAVEAIEARWTAQLAAEEGDWDGVELYPAVGRSNGVVAEMEFASGVHANLWMHHPPRTPEASFSPDTCEAVVDLTDLSARSRKAALTAARAELARLRQDEDSIDGLIITFEATVADETQSGGQSTTSLTELADALLRIDRAAGKP